MLPASLARTETAHAAHSTVICNPRAHHPARAATAADEACADAARHGYTAIVQPLLQAGADPNCKTHFGFDALHCAMECKHDETVRLLRAAGAGKQRKKLLWKWFG